MKDVDKTKGQLITELTQLRKQLTRLEGTAPAKLAGELQSPETGLNLAEVELQALLKISPLAIALISKDGHYKYLNPKFIEIFGYTLNELKTGRNWFAKAYPDHKYRKLIIATWINDLKKYTFGEFMARTFKVRCKDGSDKVIYFRPVAMESEDHFVIYEDITQMKSVEEELREHRNHLEELVEERTVELTRANRELQREITDRKRAEDTLRFFQADLQSKNESLEVLNTIADKVYGSLNLQTVAERAVASMMNYSQSPFVSVFVLDEEVGSLESLYSIGFSKEIRQKTETLLLEGSLSGVTVTHKDIVTSDDIAQDDRLDPDLKNALLKEGFRGIISVPLLFQNRVLGIINLNFKDEMPPLTDIERSTLLNMGKTIGLAMANAQYVAQIEAEIRERKRTEVILRESEEKYRALVEFTEDSVYLVDRDKRYLFINEKYMSRLGLPRDQVIGRTYRELHTGTEDDVFAEQIDRVFETGRFVQHEHRSLRDGRYFLRTLSPVMEPDESIEAVTVIAKDISERKRVEEELIHIATHDDLTGLPNRMLFNDRLDLALVQVHRHKKKLSVMLLDLDQFKEVNDTLGHSVGDQLLRSVSGRLKVILREGDTVARIGGDEFLLLLPEIGRVQDATNIANKVIKAFREPFSFDEHELHITTSMGVVIFPEDGKDTDTLMKNADIAMYTAKQKGRNNYQRYQQNMRN